jgi:hypothetical protein
VDTASTEPRQNGNAYQDKSLFAQVSTHAQLLPSSKSSLSSRIAAQDHAKPTPTFKPLKPGASASTDGPADHARTTNPSTSTAARPAAPPGAAPTPATPPTREKPPQHQPQHVAVEENLRGIFGLDGFRPLQREAIDAVLRVR